MKKRNVITIIIISMALCALSCKKEMPEALKSARVDYESNKDDFDFHLTYGIELHNADYIEEALIEFKVLEKEQPQNAIMIAYYGSTQTKAAEKASGTDKKMQLIQSGFALMDEAVKLEPDNFIVRLVRGINAYHIPDFLKRNYIALQDLQFVINLEKKSAQSVPPDALETAKKFLKLALDKDAGLQRKEK